MSDEIEPTEPDFDAEENDERGYDIGYEDGYNAGHTVGYDEGYDDGYDAGHYDGFGEAEEHADFIDEAEHRTVAPDEPYEEVDGE